MSGFFAALSFILALTGIGFMYVPVRDHNPPWYVANRTAIIGFTLVGIALLFHWAANWTIGKPLW